MTGDPILRLVRLAGALRVAGVHVALGDEVDALGALGFVDPDDADEVRRAFKCALRIRPADVAAFEAIFERLWRRGEAARVPGGSPSAPRAGSGPARPPPARPLEWPPAPAGADAGERGGAGDPPEGAEPGWSREALLRRKPFDQCQERDAAELERLVARLALRLATRRSRRLRPTAGPGQADLRRSLRRTLATDGELLRLARRARPIETARLVVLCDTSGSMDGHTRFVLAFVRALRRVAPRTEVFAFNTALTRITSWLARRGPDLMARLAEAVPDWSGGTRIGECLDAFAARHLAELVDGRTVVVVVSDGLDRGDPDQLAGAVRRIRARARRVLWLNPLLADPRYEPTARGMAAALPFVDLAPAHDLASLERLLPRLAP